MKLDEFVKEALIQIAGGVHSAQESLSDSTAKINPYTYGTAKGLTVEGGKELQYVNFDVAVTVVEGTEVGGGLTVLGLGAKGSITDTSSSVSRIKFQVPFSLPNKE